jgi:hypothetical protein
MKNFKSKLFFFSIFLLFFYATYIIELGAPSWLTYIARGFSLFLCFFTLFSFRIVFTWSHLFLILFLILYYYRLLNDTVFLNLTFGKPPFETILFAFGVTLIPTLVLLNLNLKELILYSENVFFWGFNILNILALIFRYNIDGRLSGNSTLNPITIGNIAVTSIIINIIVYKSQIFLIKKVQIAFFIFIGLIILIFSSSRGPILGLLVTLFIYFYSFISKNKSSSFKYLFYIFLFSSILYILIINADKFGFSFASRMHIDTEEGLEENRFILWSLGLEKIFINPVFGSNTTTTSGYLHNFYLEILMSTGIVGLFTFLIPFFKVLKNITSHIQSENNMMKIIALLFIQNVIGSLFSGMVYDNDSFWTLFALMLSSPNMKFYKKI